VRRNKILHRELVPDIAITRLRGTLHETYRSDWRCTYCFTCNDGIRFRPIGHGSVERGGRHRDPDQGRPWARSCSRASRRTRPSSRLGQRARASLRMVPRPRSPQALLVRLRCIRLRHPLPGRCANGSDANGSRPQGAAGSAGIELETLGLRRNSAQPHLDGDPDQVRMVLGAEFLL
jgi:hypothetical protein